VDQQRTDAAHFARELDLDDLVLPVINGRSPTDTVLPLRADRLLVVPIDEELAGVNTLIGIGLPLHIGTRRTNDFNPVLLLTADQNGCRDIACIEQVLPWGELRLLKLSMDRLGHGLIGRRGSGCGHMGDQVRGVFLACLSEVDGCHRSTSSRAFCRSALLDHRAS
jgi:hypothetical protein